MLSNLDIVELTEFRRTLHRLPELSGEEEGTAARVADALRELAPSRLLQGLGGHGVAAVFDSGAPGPTVLFRAELDALPIEERNDLAWLSQVPGKAHLCGHDGHMTMLLALGRLLSRQPVASGAVVLLFQPAEEDGSGARAVVADPAFASIQPDWAFAIHNLPGLPFGQVGTRAGLINCASMGLEIRLEGKTAHAAEPEAGVSPARAVAALVPALESLGAGGVLDDDFELVTVTHLRVGEPSFGIAPGEAQLFVTLRSAHDSGLQRLEQVARELAERAAGEAGLVLQIAVHDHFAASINHPDAVAVATSAMQALSIPHSPEGVPMRASEDFGVFGWGAKAAMLCLGPGVQHPALHNPDYDFVDELIPIGAALFERIARDLQG